VNLIDCLTAQTVEVNSTLKDPELILSRLVDLVLSREKIMDRETLLSQIHAREKLGSTGIGVGIAIPHVHHKGVEGLHVAMMTVPAGIDFHAIDDQPCTVFVIVAGPSNNREEYLRLLGEISRVLRTDRTRNAVLAAKTPEELLKTLRELKKD